MDFLSLIPGIVVAAAVPDRPTATERQTAREGAGIGIVNSIDPSPTLPQTAIAAMGRDGRCRSYIIYVHCNDRDRDRRLVVSGDAAFAMRTMERARPPGAGSLE